MITFVVSQDHEFVLCWGGIITHKTGSNTDTEKQGRNNMKGDSTPVWPRCWQRTVKHDQTWQDTDAALEVRFNFTFTCGKSFVPHRLPIIPHHAGYGFSSHSDVAVVAVVGDLRPQFIVVAQPTGIHDVAGVETGLAWFFCATRKKGALFRRNIWFV